MRLKSLWIGSFLAFGAWEVGRAAAFRCPDTASWVVACAPMNNRAQVQAELNPIPTFAGPKRRYLQWRCRMKHFAGIACGIAGASANDRGVSTREDSQSNCENFMVSWRCCLTRVRHPTRPACVSAVLCGTRFGMGASSSTRMPAFRMPSRRRKKCPTVLLGFRFRV